MHAPDYCRWAVTYQYLSPERNGSSPAASASAKKNGDNRPAKIVITKTGTVISQITDAVCGRRSESWVLDKIQLNRTPESSGLFESPVNKADPDYISVETGDFPEFSWIDAATYSGTQKWQGRDVLVFRKQAPADLLSSHKNHQIKLDINFSPGQSAFIDSDSRLPVMLQTREERRLYEFTLLPAVVQGLPGEVKSYIGEKNVRIRRMLALPARPF